MVQTQQTPDMWIREARTTAERDRFKAVNAQLMEALKHIRLIVSPHLIGQDECDTLDAAIKAAKEG